MMVTAVVDTSGRLVALSRMDNSQMGSLDIAIAKAAARKWAAPWIPCPRWLRRYSPAALLTFPCALLGLTGRAR
jgi:hypothetical protein